MIELTKERVEQILHKETQKTEELPTILRAVYTRYMRLYESYFADLDALNDEKIAELRRYHEETKSLVKYYYMDIPLDICMGLYDFENRYNARLFGPDWRELLLDSYEEFRADYDCGGDSERCIKAEFARRNLEAFYSLMDSVFREGFGTSSKTAEKVISGIAGLLFGD